MAKNLEIDFIYEDFPVIIIPFLVHNDIKEIVKNYDKELSWIGEGFKDENNVFRIESVYIPEQLGQPTTTEILDEGLEKIFDQHPEFNSDNFRYWGHSHVNMNVTPSGQDNSTMLEFAENCRFFIGTIHNKKNDMYGYIVDKERGIYYKDVEIIVQYPERDEPIDWKSIIKERVTPYNKTNTSNQYNIKNINQGSNAKRDKEKKIDDQKEINEQRTIEEFKEFIGNSQPLQSLEEWNLLRPYYDTKVSDIINSDLNVGV